MNHRCIPLESTLPLTITPDSSEYIKNKESIEHSRKAVLFAHNLIAFKDTVVIIKSNMEVPNSLFLTKFNQ
jgi:hypothetical protein